MKSKDIRFAKEYCFTVKCTDCPFELKEYKIYDYRILDNTLLIGSSDNYAPVEIQNVKSDVLNTLETYKERSILRLDKANPTTDAYTFTLLYFYQHTRFNEQADRAFTESYQIVLDSAIYPRLKQLNLKDSKEAVKYLIGQLVLNTPRGQYWFAYGTNQKNAEQCLCGKDILVTVRPSSQNYLHVIEIRKRHNTTENLITLMSGKFEIKDSTEQIRRLTQAFREKYDMAIRDNSALLNLWNVYNDLDREAVKRDAEEMGFLRYKKYRRRGGKLVFDIIDGYTSPSFLRSGMQYVAIGTESFNSDDPSDYQQTDSVVIGSEFDPSCSNTKEFIISEESADAFKDLPQEGYIRPSIYGSETQAKRRDRARDSIQQGKNPLIGLNLLIQSGDIVGEIGKERAAVTDRLRKYIFGSDKTKDFNDRQKEAIRIALNTPDIAIIQGPPGTGKTQVIKAIIERINELENGEARILISSTQHDAVDNAAKGITYGGVPVNRVAKTKQRDEGEAPIFGWIDDMITACDQWLTRNPIKSTIPELYNIRKELDDLEGEDLSDKLHELHTFLLENNYPTELLSKIRQADAKLAKISAAAVSAPVTDQEEALLIEFLTKQRTDKDFILSEDGKENLKYLTICLKNEYNITIPAYWRTLRRADADTPDLDQLIADFANDITELKQKHLTSSQTQAAAPDTTAIKTELKAIIDEAMDSLITNAPQKAQLHNSIWQFKHELSNIQNVKSLISSYSQVNAATCQQAANRNLSPAMKGFDDVYDYVIIDEAARSNPLDLLIPMSMGKKIILVGDHKQLPHMVERDIVNAVIKKTKDAEAGSILIESLFQRLYNKVKEADEKSLTDDKHPVRIKRTCTLNKQFRMHSVICELINVFYQTEQLETACSDEEKRHDLNLYNNKPLVWLDVPADSKHPHETRGISKSRPCEIKIIKQELAKILAANDTFDIGIITFYRKQADLLKKMVDEEFPSESYRISVGTVDAFQGKEFDIVILSTVRSNTESALERRVGFLNNNNRLCVAFSRAKRLLITVGDASTVAANSGIVIVEPLYELYKRSQKEDIGYYASF